MSHLDGHFKSIDFVNNTLSSDHEESLILSGENINFKDNRISVSHGGKIKLNSGNSIYLENNLFLNAENLTDSNVLHLEISDFVRNLTITKSNLGRLKSNFISGVTVKYFKIINSSLKLDNGNIINVRSGK